MVIQFPDINLDGVKGVLLDLDNSLYAYDQCHEAGLEACLDLLSHKIPAGSREQFLSAYDKSRKVCHLQLASTAASHSRLLYFNGLLEILTGATQPDLALELEELYWSSYMELMELDSKALSFLETCKQKSIPVCIVTDLTLQIQLRKLIRLGIRDHIQFVMSSEEAGIEKPAAKIFLLALAKLNLRMKDVIMIGDSEEKDIAGAEDLGIKSYPVTCLESK